jgi:hypothetical protein
MGHTPQMMMKINTTNLLKFLVDILAGVRVKRLAHKKVTLEKIEVHR